MTAADAVTEAVLDAVADIAGVARPTIRFDADLANDLKIDSLEFVRLVQLVEDALAVKIPDSAGAAAHTVGALVAAAQQALDLRGLSE